ncbi:MULTISPECIES: SOS response-associated peptidase [unclassified Curtobacterium]|uniref:SOS response-associated peptidase n=1 Tax=unclassified Curtobacterium TaxID=257496 RepID=UPI000DA85F5E|nr:MULTISPECIES: SOS response-associated peptidase [unclassified Curtobacterium]PZE78339.1 SOS response-associated peptidase [Curtobacterium sp. MCBD17_019]WIE55176.1 SOS response-associated peptidase [Curtobacterium sp. MCBD17_003]
MCGRFVVSDTTADLLPELVGELASRTEHVDEDTGVVSTGLVENYNIAPTDDVQAVRQFRGERAMPDVHWGFVPSWAKDFRKQRPQPINARIETVATSGMFRTAFAGNRCIVPAQGYYEWVLTETGKEPHYIHQPDGALAMAGVVSAWPDPTKPEGDPDKWRLSMAIITRDAHVAPGEVHDRMPAFLTPDSYDAWLDDTLSPDQLLALLDRESHEVAHDLVQYEVSRAVNSVRNAGPQLIEPVA